MSDLIGAFEHANPSTYGTLFRTILKPAQSLKELACAREHQSKVSPKKWLSYCYWLA